MSPTAAPMARLLVKAPSTLATPTARKSWSTRAPTRQVCLPRSKLCVLLVPRSRLRLRILPRRASLVFSTARKSRNSRKSPLQFKILTLKTAPPPCRRSTPNYLESCEDRAPPRVPPTFLLARKPRDWRPLPKPATSVAKPL